jgi:hypothetical protein
MYRYINDILPINNHNFHDDGHFIYSDELEIKDTAASNKSALYLDILHNIDSNGRLTTTLYDRCEDFDFAITFLFYLVIHYFYLLMVCISPG